MASAAAKSLPASWELPVAVRELAHSKAYDGIIALSAVIRGDTPHFDYVCDAVTRELGKASWQYRIPIGFGVLTTIDVEVENQRAAREAFLEAGVRPNRARVIPGRALEVLPRIAGEGF